MSEALEAERADRNAQAVDIAEREITKLRTALRTIRDDPCMVGDTCQCHEKAALALAAPVTPRCPTCDSDDPAVSNLHPAGDFYLDWHCPDDFHTPEPPE